MLGFRPTWRSPFIGINRYEASAEENVPYGKINVRPKSSSDVNSNPKQTFFRFVNIGFIWHFFCFCFVCARTVTKPFFRPSQPGSCAWLSPFLLCADCTCVLVYVLLCFDKHILGNRYGPGVSPRASQWGHTHDPRSPTSLLTLSPLR